MLVASSRNLKNVANCIEFAKYVTASTYLDHSACNDAKTYGIQAFKFEPIESISIKMEMTTAPLVAGLKALQQPLLIRSDTAELN